MDAFLDHRRPCQYISSQEAIVQSFLIANKWKKKKKEIGRGKMRVLGVDVLCRSEGKDTNATI